MTLKLALENIKVIDFSTNIAGPVAAVLMAERGAQIIHVEKPGSGDDSRYFAPLLDGSSLNYLWGNRGKKSVTMDLKSETDKEIVLNMIRGADVVIESFRPGVMKKLGLDYETVRTENPGIIYCSISAFGQTGPYSGRPGYDIIAQAYSGMINKTGDPDGKPMKVGYAIGDYFAAINAFGSVMMALYQREVQGKGQHIDISLCRGLSWINNFFDAPITGITRSRMGNHDSQLSPYGVFTTPDNNAVVIGAVNQSTWKRLCDAMGVPELAEDPRYITNDMRVENRDEVIALIEDWLGRQSDINEVCRILNEYGVPSCKVNAPEDLLADEHFIQSGWYGDIPLPKSVSSVTSFKGFLGLADFSECDLLNLPAADLGEDNDYIQAEFAR